jgi:hypothetical protein
VQRFLIVLKPEGENLFRLLIVGRKRLPKAGEHERFWGFVDHVTDSADALERRLRESEYQTQTRGRRHAPAVRPAGEGVYAITLLNGQMHLAYALELPKHPSEVQRAFNIAPEAGFALSIKNPEAGAPPGAGLSEEEKPEYPEKLQEELRERRFEREDVRMLDYPGAEFILVGAREDPERAYHLELPERSKTMLTQISSANCAWRITPPRKAAVRRRMAMSGRSVAARALAPLDH